MNSWGEILSLIPKYREERELMKQVGVEGTDNDAMSSKKNSQYGIHFFRTNADYMRYLAEELNTPVGSKAVLPKNVRRIILYIQKDNPCKLCTIMDCAEYIKHPGNPMYDQEKSKTYFLVVDLDRIPGEFIRYAIAHKLLMQDFALNSNRVIVMAGS